MNIDITVCQGIHVQAITNQWRSKWQRRITTVNLEAEIQGQHYFDVIGNHSYQRTRCADTGLVTRIDCQFRIGWCRAAKAGCVNIDVHQCIGTAAVAIVGDLYQRIGDIDRVKGKTSSSHGRIS